MLILFIYGLVRGPVQRVGLRRRQAVLDEPLRVLALRRACFVPRTTGLVVRHLADEQRVRGEVLDAGRGALEAGMVGPAQARGAHVFDVVGHHAYPARCSIIQVPSTPDDEPH